jgi:FkbM family methyltransferase
MISFSPRCALRSLMALGPLPALSLHVRQTGHASISIPGIKYPITVGRNRGDRGAFDQVMIQRNYDDPAIRILPDPKTIVDAGAHIGLASVFFANLFPSAKIIAIEPNPRNFRLLQENAAPYPNIHTIHAAAWPRHANLEIDELGTSWASTVHESPNGAIPGIPLSSLAAKVDILKIDVEGSEKEIFEQNAIPSCKVLLIECHDYLKPGCTAAVLHTIRSRSFSRSRISDVDVFAFG